MKPKKYFCISFCLLAAFVFLTLALCYVDVQPIGPCDSSVGFAALNGFFHDLTGVHMTLYVITDWLGLIPVAVALSFALLGLIQWIKRKHILKVDADILILGIFYLVVFAAYLLFEEFPVNYRPILINNFLEASYPSSTTLLVLCIMPTATMQLHSRIGNTALRKIISAFIIIFMTFMVVCRLISGVHWLTDIMGGALLSAGLVMLYRAFVSLTESNKKGQS